MLHLKAETIKVNKAHLFYQILSPIRIDGGLLGV